MQSVSPEAVHCEIFSSVHFLVSWQPLTRSIFMCSLSVRGKISIFFLHCPFWNQESSSPALFDIKVVHSIMGDEEFFIQTCSEIYGIENINDREKYWTKENKGFIDSSLVLVSSLCTILFSHNYFCLKEHILQSNKNPISIVWGF